MHFIILDETREMTNYSMPSISRQSAGVALQYMTDDFSPPDSVTLLSPRQHLVRLYYLSDPHL